MLPYIPYMDPMGIYIYIYKYKLYILYMTHTPLLTPAGIHGHISSRSGKIQPLGEPREGWILAPAIDSACCLRHDLPSTTGGLRGKTNMIWLVVEPPLWKIWKSVGVTIPNIWKDKNVPNHQPVMALGKPEKNGWMMLMWRGSDVT